MALVTVQRSPSPSDTPDTVSSDLADFVDGESSCRSTQRSRNLSESYVSFKGAALILPQSECQRTVTKGVNTDIHSHLQSMFCLLRPQDTIKMAIKLDSTLENLIRYMAVVSTTGVHDTEECAIIGVDIQEEATIGLVLPVWADMTIKLDGDGGFSITTDSRHHIFKPLSVQAMWSAWQCLNKINDIARLYNYYPTGLTHTWVQYYKVTSSQQCINEWDAMEDLESQRPEMSSVKSSDVECLERLIRAKLKEVMMTVDLEEVTSKYLRERLEEALGKSLKPYKQFIDQEMIVILRQMDSPSKIFEFLYLGSEWNASNLEELNKNKIGYILNVTREIDNFFPGLFKYKNIRVYDVEEADLLKYWEETFRFISEAKWNNSKVLVHCKMGVSRSASTVISFAMKEKHWSLDEAYNYVKGKRSVIKPNDGFMKQLKMYEGILTASNQRHNKLWRSTSVGNLMPNAHSTPAAKEQSNMATSIPTLSSSFGSHRHDSLPILAPRSSQCLNESFDSMDVSSDDSICTSDDDEVAAAGDDDDDEPIQFMMDGCSNSSPHNSDHWEDVFQGSSPAGGHIQQNKARQCKDPKHERVFSDSESCNEMLVDVDFKHTAGGYEVAMLEAVQEEALTGKIVDSEIGSYRPWSLLHLHPDIILERTLNHYRNKYLGTRMARQYRKRTRVRDGNMPVVVVSDSNILTAGQKSAATVRVKPDDFWIKDEQLSMISQTQSECAENGAVNIPVATAYHLGQSPQPNIAYCSPVSSTTSDTSESIQAYIKEDIPWSPGTVRRQAQDLECRLTTSDVQVPSDVSSSQQCQPRTGFTSTQPHTDTDTPSQSAPGTNSPVSDGQPSDLSSWSLTGAVASQSGYHSDGGSTASTSLDSPVYSPRQSRSKTVSHIYESEDIQLEPGHVLRTKLEIEHRERSCSYSAMSPDKDTRPVQRSSSCKDERHSSSKGRFDRTSDRRRTCLPVLHPSPTSEKPFSLALSAGNSSSVDIQADNVSGQKVIYTIGDDALEIEQGKVKRQTRDFEGAVFEEGESSSKVKPVTDTVVQDEVEVLIRQGSVKRTKQDMMERFGLSGKTTSAGDGMPQVSASVKTEEKNESSPVSSTDEPSDHATAECENSERQFSLQNNHTKLKHSQSSPQLCLGAPAYPEEEEITWSVGTVRQQKEAIERQGKADSIDQSGLKSSLSSETLRLIRQVGTAWLESAERRASGEDAEVHSGPGLVRRLSDQMQGKSASEEIKKRMLMLEKKVLDMDAGSFSQWKSCMSRSASMRESPRLKAAAVHRTRSVKERIATAGVCDKCFTIREGKPISKGAFVTSEQVSSQDCRDDGSEPNEAVLRAASDAVLHKDHAHGYSRSRQKQDIERRASLKDMKKYFESSVESKGPKTCVRRTKSDGLRNVPHDGVFKSSISVNVSSSCVKQNLETCEVSTNQNLVSQTSRNILVKTVSDSEYSCTENVASAPASGCRKDYTVISSSTSELDLVRTDGNTTDTVSTANKETSAKDVGSSSEMTTSVLLCTDASQDQDASSTRGTAQTRNVTVIKKQSGSPSAGQSFGKTVSVVSDGAVAGVSGIGRKRQGSKKIADSAVEKTRGSKCSEHSKSLDHKRSSRLSDRVPAMSQVKPETIASKDAIQTTEQSSKVVKRSLKHLASKSHDIKDLLNMFEGQRPDSGEQQKLCPERSSRASEQSNASPAKPTARPVQSEANEACDKSTTVILDPKIEEQAIKKLFPEKLSACHMGIHGTRRHRRYTIPPRQGAKTDTGSLEGSGRERGGTTDGDRFVIQEEEDCMEKEPLHKVCKQQGKSHPLTRLTHVENQDGTLIHARREKTFYNSL